MDGGLVPNTFFKSVGRKTSRHGEKKSGFQTHRTFLG
jgi:hypothetical protein